ncbi:unnamed protein product [Hyaloperonospora brassicae]|uniref:Uncharacterized protein n=1 Tax=Hyaloperonospora brassicae TaxID=162125 RepID=A0AAV0TA64_HYABA|nr:unnamed protein product [Hyaloperonospora brassicae]
MDLEISAHAPPAHALHGSAGTDHGALSARNVLLRQKLRERKRYDSADDAMKKAAAAARASSRASLLPQGTSVPVAASNGRALHDGRQARGCGLHEAVSSPCATSATGRIQCASMSPSRAGKYGALEGTGPSFAADDKQMPAAGGTKYGKLSAAHVLIRRKLKERKRFDSADYAMEKQGRATDFASSAVAAGPATASGAGQPDGALAASSHAGIDHQVKHIKLSEAPDGRVASPVVANAAQAALAARAARYAGLAGARSTAAGGTSRGAQAACDRYGLDKSAVSAGAAAARNIVLQRKLAERKMFDSADHFKEAA